jgi:hypothetical protein
MKPWWEARLGAIICGAGVIWAAHVSTFNVTEINQSITNIIHQQGPMELAGAGFLMWLHAKWRQSYSVS